MDTFQKVILKASNLKYQVNDKTIFDIPALEIFEDEIVGIIGPNGAGKSTLLKVLSFLENPTSGEIFFQGQKASGLKGSLSLRRKFAVVFQESLLLKGNVEENIALGLKLRKVSSSDIKKRISQWLNLFEINHLVNQNISSLSGGEAQRVSLARALILEPQILFLDEPFSSLDTPTKNKLIIELKQILKSTKTTVVLVSHNFSEISYLSDRILAMKQGKIVQSGTPQDLLSHPKDEIRNLFISLDLASGK